MEQHLNDVRRYDALAAEEVVAGIVKHLGVALHNRDSALVSCGDEAERDRVAERWCIKKLGVADMALARRVVELVCRSMSADKAKNRVTFYYLCAKHLGRFDAL